MTDIPRKKRTVVIALRKLVALLAALGLGAGTVTALTVPALATPELADETLQGADDIGDDNSVPDDTDVDDELSGTSPTPEPHTPPDGTKEEVEQPTTTETDDLSEEQEETEAVEIFADEGDAEDQAIAASGGFEPGGVCGSEDTIELAYIDLTVNHVELTNVSYQVVWASRETGTHEEVIAHESVVGQGTHSFEDQTIETDGHAENWVLLRVQSDDPNIDPVFDTYIDYGPCDPEEEPDRPASEKASFHVGDACYTQDSIELNDVTVDSGYDRTLSGLRFQAFWFDENTQRLDGHMISEDDVDLQPGQNSLGDVSIPATTGHQGLITLELRGDEKLTPNTAAATVVSMESCDTTENEPDEEPLTTVSTPNAQQLHGESVITITIENAADESIDYSVTATGRESGEQYIKNVALSQNDGKTTITLAGDGGVQPDIYDVVVVGSDGTNISSDVEVTDAQEDGPDEPDSDNESSDNSDDNDPDDGSEDRIDDGSNNESGDDAKQDEAAEEDADQNSDSKDSNNGSGNGSSNDEPNMNDANGEYSDETSGKDSSGGEDAAEDNTDHTNQIGNAQEDASTATDGHDTEGLANTGVAVGPMAGVGLLLLMTGLITATLRRKRQSRRL